MPWWSKTLAPGQSSAAIELDTIFGNLRMSADNFFDQGRVDVDTTHDDHFVTTAKDAAFQCELLAATRANGV